MTTKEIEILDHVNNIAALKTVDARVNYVYNAYDFGTTKTNEIREYFKENLKA